MPLNWQNKFSVEQDKEFILNCRYEKITLPLSCCSVFTVRRGANDYSQESEVSELLRMTLNRVTNFKYEKVIKQELCQSLGDI